MSEYLSNAQLERMIGLLAIGISVALEKKRLSNDEAAHILFSPSIMRVLKEQDRNPSLVEMVHVGTEIDDVSRLVPKQLPDLLARIRKAGLEAISNAPVYDFQEEKWLESLLWGS